MIYDIAIIGGGPAGLTAGLYGARGGAKVIILEGLAVGGQTIKTHNIENYSGINSISGYDLAEKMHQQATNFGVEFLFDNVISLDLKADIKVLNTEYSGNISSKTVILAMGANPRQLNIDRESELIGAGISYCATCDGMFYKGKDVVIFGGGNTAVTDAIYLKRFARDVHIVHRRDSYRASVVLVESMRKLGVIEHLDCVVEELIGTPLNEVKLKNLKTNQDIKISVSGAFVAVGTTPNTQLVSDIINTVDGYIITEETMATNIPKVYAAGDIRAKTLRQIITACADGAIAGQHALEDLI